MKNIKLLGIYEDVVSIRSRLKISIMNIYLPEMIELCFELLEEYCLLSEEERRDATNWTYCCNAAGTLARVAQPGLRERITAYIAKYPFLSENRIAEALQRNKYFERMNYS